MRIGAPRSADSRCSFRRGRSCRPPAIVRQPRRSVSSDERCRFTATVAAATGAVRVTAFTSELALLECTGALIAKNAAETIRKVWMCFVFMRTPFSTPAQRSSAACGTLRFVQVGSLDQHFKSRSCRFKLLHAVTAAHQIDSATSYARHFPA
ncbi:conserved hypothetical protein [Paraburkholderia piptadeniae]|uniref:Uncharacterized protein n=1 Tax=Paraburkholderia piptadeniae TaxID=1701573 RepID=A0A1N7SAP0_9BURK|nr:conserved hypothetical protein [Paraburkholderia piptadeniae]